MTAGDIITQAQMLSGVGTFEGTTEDVNAMGTANAIFKQTLSQINNDGKLSLVQEAMALPPPIAIRYQLPRGCRRVIKCMSGSTQLRKTDFSEVERSRSTPAFANIYAVNGRWLELATAAAAKIVYAKEFGDYTPDEEVDLPPESLDYAICLLAYNLAIAFNNEGAISRCQLMAEKSYNMLLSNTRANEGMKYQSAHTALSRFGGHSGIAI